VTQGNSLDLLRELPADSVDSCVTDPPYELGFMGKKWDASGIAYSVELWREVMRVLKPGGHLLAFGGTRTHHRMVCAIEDAGFEIRDEMQWIYGSGFPKSLDVSKAIDKAAGALRHESVRFCVAGRTDKNLPDPIVKGYVRPDPTTPAARKWHGWGTALKPANEPICVARKPLIGTVAENVLEYGTGAINVDAGRVEYANAADGGDWERFNGHQSGLTIRKNLDGGDPQIFAERVDNGKQSGRWPANVLHDGSDEVLAAFGDAARFFYCAKASRRERDAGCEDERNGHPTVKPLALMQYLVRLVTPQGGTVLDPFTGSGTTGAAALESGCAFIGFELNPEYCEIANRRIEAAAPLFAEVGK